MLRNELLSYNIFIENEYFDKYIQLISDNLSKEKELYKTQRHHIIPQSYFKYNNIEVDSTNKNIVNLFHKDHVLAHYYLSKCISDKKLANAQLYAIRRLIGSVGTEDELLNLLPDYQLVKEEISKAIGDIHRGKIVSAETRLKQSEIRKGSIPWNIGITGAIKDSEETKEKKSCAQKRIWLEHQNDSNFRTRGGYHFTEEGRLKHQTSILNKHIYHSTVTNEEKYFADDDVIPEGFIIGRSAENIQKNRDSHIGVVYSEETYEKIAEKHRGRHYYTNGVEIVKLYECPDGYWPCGVGKNAGRKRYNNGVENKMFYPDNVPDGFTPGYLKKEVEDELQS